MEMCRAKLFYYHLNTARRRAEVVRAHRVEFAAIVQRSHPARFLEHLERFYRHQIESGGGSTEDEEDGDVVDANGNAMDEEDDESPTSAAFFAFCRNIKRCHLLPVVWPVVCRLIRTRLELKISEIIDGTYDEEFLEALKEWKQDCVDPWLELVFQPDDTVDGERACLIEEQNKIGDALVETYCDRRIAELFDIIVEFPESEVALHELKVCVFLFEKFWTKIENMLAVIIPCTGCTLCAAG